MAQGYSVPAKMVYYSRPQTRVTKNVRDQEELIFARKTYAVDASSEAAKASALQWAKQPIHEYQNGKYITIPAAEPEVSERDNTPFNYIEIYNVEYGAEGRVVFKVITEEGYAFDVRLPELFETLLRCGADPGGRISGKFIWVKLGSQYRITCVGSPTHKRCIAEGEKRKKTDKLKPIKAKELVIGGLYENKNGNKFIYIGKEGKNYVFCHPYVYGYADGNSNTPYNSTYTYKWLDSKEDMEIFKELCLNKNLDFRPCLDKRSPIPVLYIKTSQFDPEDVEWLKSKCPPQ